MLQALLLAACLASASSEWVEISQNHYRKPLRTNSHSQLKEGSPYYPNEEDAQRTHDYTRKEDVRFPFNPHKDTTRATPDIHHKEETSVQHNFQHQYQESIYSNQSIAEHKWNLNKYHGSGDIERIDPAVKVKANITPEFSLEIYGTVADNIPELVTRNKVIDQDTGSATIERVQNKGNVKRVHLPNTPVKSPSVTNFASEIQPIRRSDIRMHGTTSAYDENSDELDIRSDIFQSIDKVIDVTPYSDVKPILSTVKETMDVFTSTRSTPVRSYDRIMTSTTRPISELDTSYHKFQAKTENKMEVKNKTKTIKISNPLDSDSDPDIRFQYTQRKPFKTVNENREDNFKDIPKLHTINNKHTEQVEADFEEVTIGTDDRISDDDTISSNQNEKPQKPKVTKDDNSNDEGGHKTNNRVKENTMENVLKFMKVVADVISKNSKRGVEGKVHYLNELKDTLLYSIKERVDATWPDDTSLTARRHSRAASARGHVEFPSSESALMTISFLTFAVFLIKLVLQVIQTYKTKAMVMAPLVVATAGRALTQLPTSR